MLNSRLNHVSAQREAVLARCTTLEDESRAVAQERTRLINEIDELRRLNAQRDGLGEQNAQLRADLNKALVNEKIREAHAKSVETFMERNAYERDQEKLRADQLQIQLGQAQALLVHLQSQYTPVPAAFPAPSATPWVSGLKNMDSAIAQGKKRKRDSVEPQTPPALQPRHGKMTWTELLSLSPWPLADASGSGAKSEPSSSSRLSTSTASAYRYVSSAGLGSASLGTTSSTASADRDSLPSGPGSSSPSGSASGPSSLPFAIASIPSCPEPRGWAAFYNENPQLKEFARIQQRFMKQPLRRNPEICTACQTGSMPCLATKDATPQNYRAGDGSRIHCIRCQESKRHLSIQDCGVSGRTCRPRVNSRSTYKWSDNVLDAIADHHNYWVQAGGEFPFGE
uniref:Uncharacterized protein n=1 Tax=Mycena chlorophos TaxID=658473 RepID=A0ABQ0KU61_MYCCL|nr:predicted protein [Mycena chlorophos]